MDYDTWNGEGEPPKAWAIFSSAAMSRIDPDGWGLESDVKKSKGRDVRGVSVERRTLVRSANGKPSAYGYYMQFQWRAKRNNLVSDIKKTKSEAISSLLEKEEK